MVDIEKNYTIKILILFLATLVSIFAIWYVLMREESVDWLSSQISHQLSPYVMAENENGFFIDNTLLGYGFNLPEGFKTNGAKNLVLFMGEADKKKCEIKHFSLDTNKANGLMTDETKFIIPSDRKKLVFELVNKNEINDCEKYLMEIKNSIMFN